VTSSPSPLAPLASASAEPLPSDPALDRLRAAFAEVPSVLVCYSGGTDSALVLALAHRLLGDRAVGMTAVSPSLAPSERDEAVALAREIGARHELVASNEIETEGYAQNGADRCFYCKSELYRVAAKKQVEWGLACTMNGTNTDDLGDYRPGLDAAREASVKSPLVEAGLGKSEVRRLAALLGLRVWDKPAAACLSSRLPYGTRVTRERLEQIAAFEAALKALALRQVRVRWHGLPELDGGRSGGMDATARRPRRLAGAQPAIRKEQCAGRWHRGSGDIQCTQLGRRGVHHDQPRRHRRHQSRHAERLAPLSLPRL